MHPAILGQGGWDTSSGALPTLAPEVSWDLPSLTLFLTRQENQQMAALKVIAIQLSISEYVGQAHHVALCEVLREM